MTPARIEFRGIGKRYGTVQAVKPLDLVVEGGTLVTLLGPSGCGKTTLLRMIAGLEAPSEGRILIGGRDVTDLPPGERNVSMVFQSYALFPHMTVLENVAYGLVSSGLSRRAAARRAEAALDGVGLPGFGPRQTFEMSGGQQQRVALARALVLEPEVLLFDEPLSNLDARLRRSMRDDIRALQQRLGVTVVYVTHDQGEALAVSDRIVVMRNAGIAQAGTPMELYVQPDTVFVATFMGEANHVRGMIEAIEGPLATVAAGPLQMRLPHRGLPMGPCDLILRPEAVRLAQDGPLPAAVRRATYMGAQIEYRLATPIGDLLAIMPSAGPTWQAGDDARAALRPEGVVLVRADM
ncbi:ABC transporter ATP-binding protein [Paracraurococcus ruber]|uniref:ABC transporter ATP-binding protein n=1 Tax=Paracraurococcus ruber TaxID=77675 RepID=A0ABS1CT83_9PROT|nr:ABC transporter ATP-binding protein [Paracraurococcus ruber]MBK1657212.1 ABC transporter ATP-binding protein [Paracraurococcus ruber]TDG32562.1 ABC transporter ATP-binding protein [Paracraurococcus ruber]